MFDALEDVAGYRRPTGCESHWGSDQCGEKDNVWRSHADSTLAQANWSLSRLRLRVQLSNETGRGQCGQATKGVWGMSWHQKAVGRGRPR